MGVPLAAGVITVAAWLMVAIITGNDRADTLVALAPFLMLGALACLAGWRGDSASAWFIYLGGIVGATIVAWAAGAVGVEPDAEPAMRSSYHLMLVVIAAVVAAVVGGLAVALGYLVSRMVRRRTQRS